MSCTDLSLVKSLMITAGWMTLSKSCLLYERQGISCTGECQYRNRVIGPGFGIAPTTITGLPGRGGMAHQILCYVHQFYFA